MTMDCRDAIDEIAAAVVRLRRLCELAERCGRGGAAAVYYESADVIREIEYARGVISQSLKMPGSKTVKPRSRR